MYHHQFPRVKHPKREPMEEGYIERLLGKAKEERFELLIGHNPEYFKEYVKWGADLTVSGHVHGGVVKVPFFGGLISPSFRYTFIRYSWFPIP